MSSMKLHHTAVYLVAGVLLTPFLRAESETENNKEHEHPVPVVVSEVPT